MTPPTGPVAQRIIGLTGGIGMGKSTASHYIQQVHRVPILDADELAREAVQPGSSILAAIAQRYGDGMLSADGGLDRPALATIIFQNEDERRWVETQIHPYVRDRMTQMTQALQTDVVWSVPLLFEAGLTEQVTQIWVVYCTPEQQRQRLQQRGLSSQQIQARIETQWPIERKLAQADVRLDNRATLDVLHQQIDGAIRV
ncbi:MAG: dephospho-CoA kinase [Elainellaceae cyanobacterium]